MKLIGHENTKKIIRRFLDRNYPSYSFLFEGKDCIGKKAVALLTARAYLCEKQYGFGCGECSSCRQAQETIEDVYSEEKKERNVHPDIMLVSPEKEIKISQIRQVVQFLRLKKKKAVIIEKAEKMNTEASNALLKTLEEPPENSMLILTTSDQKKLLPTIVSRCKKIRFSPLSPEEIKQIISLRLSDEKLVKTLTVLADGSMCIPDAVAKKSQLFKYAKDLYTLLSLRELHPEGIITFAQIFDSLELEEIRIILDITEKIIYKKTLKGDVDPQLYEDFIKERKTLEKALEKGVKKKLAVEGMYFALKS
ncbi:DNA polymerase III subunit delta' [Persephonella sp.]